MCSSKRKNWNLEFSYFWQLNICIWHTLKFFFGVSPPSFNLFVWQFNLCLVQNDSGLLFGYLLLFFKCHHQRSCTVVNRRLWSHCTLLTQNSWKFYVVKTSLILKLFENILILDEFFKIEELFMPQIYGSDTSAEILIEISSQNNIHTKLEF